MRKIILYILSMLAGFAANAQQLDTLTIPGTNVMTNIRYGQADAKQNFDLYLPSGGRPDRGWPLMIWIHGGGWRLGTKREMEIPYLATHGYAIASIDYRFSRDSAFPAQVRDCNAAIRMLWQHAGEWGLDTSRWVIAGASAGGHLASLIAMSRNNMPKDFDAYPLGDHPYSIKGVINFYGPADFYAFHGDETGYKVDSATSSVSLLLGGPSVKNPAWARYASPATYVDAGDPPVLILHGDKDPIIPLYLDQLFYHVLQQAGVRSELLVLPGAGHGGPAFSSDTSRAKVLSFLEGVWKRTAAAPLMSWMPKGVQSLNGEWTFAEDPMKTGEAQQWQNPGPTYEGFDKVQVPHSFSVDPRYQFYTGTAWYFKKFKAAAPSAGARQFLRFAAVFYRAKVFFNGHVVGQHEGGYTPFEIEVTDRLKAENYLAVEVDNSWDTTTIPGAKTIAGYELSNWAPFFPWINYGGLTRPVTLVTRPAVYIQRVKVIAVPDLARRNAKVQVVVALSGAGGVVNACVLKEGETKSIVCRSGSGGNGSAMLGLDISSKDLQLWDPDHPRLYRAVISMGADTVSTTFGIRSLRVHGTQLLLNGEAVRLGGANRPIDYPGYGSLDPQQVLDQDLGLMKSGGMELSRIIHYPVSDEFLDWADRHGLMIIEEAGNWQMTPKQMSDPMMRAKFEQQMREMVEKDWNHPCIAAWSVGNEFQSQTPEGKSWVADMSKYVRTMDTTRLITFASMIVWRDIIKGPQDEASQYVDFISANIYGDYLKRLRHIHSIYPDKPVFVSEFGIRTDAVKDEAGRIEHLRQAMDAFRQCDFVVGASVWTFNDYLSRFPGTNPNGYRPWGLVGPDRTPRGMYIEWQEQFAPAVLELVGRNGKQATIRVTARKDFPSYVMRDYTLRCGDQDVVVPVLRPGESKEITVQLPGDGAIELVKPGGFIILKKNF